MLDWLNSVAFGLIAGSAISFFGVYAGIMLTFTKENNRKHKNSRTLIVWILNRTVQISDEIDQHLRELQDLQAPMAMYSMKLKDQIDLFWRNVSDLIQSDLSESEKNEVFSLMEQIAVQLRLFELHCGLTNFDMNVSEDKMAERINEFRISIDNIKNSYSEISRISKLTSKLLKRIEK
ncbi:hypothetical protein [Roseibium marinum]|uniref:Uncharacterized protein n=1 Tax=Roseibium marinum TaxID=281252 RepID=A0A2S3V230_9HYPH|nr:hypothetical protein [Roseibium marinum]POF34034.1 hypothetical protein CLV41_101485 [Roseibium marinum]